MNRKTIAKSSKSKEIGDILKKIYENETKFDQIFSFSLTKAQLKIHMTQINRRPNTIKQVTLTEKDSNVY